MKPSYTVHAKTHFISNQAYYVGVESIWEILFDIKERVLSLANALIHSVLNESVELKRILYYPLWSPVLVLIWVLEPHGLASNY